jgi:hypothetical protein
MTRLGYERQLSELLGQRDSRPSQRCDVQSPSGAPDQARRLWLEAPAAYMIYEMVVVLYFGVPAIRHGANGYMGIGPDPTQYMWFLVWWPYAIPSRSSRHSSLRQIERRRSP